MTKPRGVLLTAVACLALPMIARAEPPAVLSIPSLQLEPGQNLTVPVDLASTAALTMLVFDLVYWPADELCSALVDPAAVTVRAAGRVSEPPQEDLISCARGRIRVAVFDLTGRIVVPAGTGPIIEIAFGHVTPGATARVHFGLKVVEANEGPIRLPVLNLNSPGPCSWTCPPESTDDNPALDPSCWWACHACLPGETCDEYNPLTLAIGPSNPTITPGGGSPGPGSCDPAPCPGAVTPPATVAAACPAGATEASVTCRLDELIAMVGNDGGDGERLIQPLRRAERRIRRAGDLRASGRNGKARTFLRRAAGDVRVFGNRLGSRRGTRLIGASAKAAMLALVAPLRADLQALAPATGR